MKLKMIAAALAIAAAGNAHAIIEDGALNNGELFMTVWDQDGQTSYILDLNVHMNDFLSYIATPGHAYHYAADATMTTFLAGVTNKSGLLFAIGAMDSNGATATDFHRYITTASSIDLNDTVTNLDLKQLGNYGAQFLGNVNGMIGDSNSLVVTDKSVLAYAGSGVWGSNWGSGANFTSTGLIGDGDLNMYFLSQTSGTFAARLNPSHYEALLQDGNQVVAKLDMDGNLTIAAVPEAETYALMLAGLGLVGFMARRRKAV